MVRQNLVKVVADEPPDRDVDLGLPQEAPIVNDAQEKPSQHQPKRSLRINPRPAVVVAVEARHFAPKPGEIQHPIDLGEDVIVGDKLA